MVARGLEKHLKVDQREFLMNTLLRVCGDQSRRSVAEALGLVCLVCCFYSLSGKSRICCSLILGIYLSDISNCSGNFLLGSGDSCQISTYSLCFEREFCLQPCKVDLNKQCGEGINSLSSVLCTVPFYTSRKFTCSNLGLSLFKNNFILSSVLSLSKIWKLFHPKCVSSCV